VADLARSPLLSRSDDLPRPLRSRSAHMIWLPILSFFYSSIRPSTLSSTRGLVNTGSTVL